MTSPAGERHNHAIFCWEQVSRSDRLFRISRLFAFGEVSDRLLPLYALFSALDQICADIQDEQVALSKLNWWHDQCVRGEPGLSNHPILCELQRTGALSRIESRHFVNLLASAALRLERKPPTDLNGLMALCQSFAGPQLRLEHAIGGLEGDAPEGQNVRLLSRALLQLVHEGCTRAGSDGYWWVPLNLLARHGIAREQFATDTDAPEVRALFVEIFEEGDVWSKAAGAAGDEGSGPGKAARHPWVVEALSARKLRALKTRKPGDFKMELGRLGIADVFEAWRAARRFSRR